MCEVKEEEEELDVKIEEETDDCEHIGSRRIANLPSLPKRSKKGMRLEL
jgi:hypothetical protein